MLQDWENFMSPSGGTMENSLHFGWPSLFAEFGANLIGKHVYDPLRDREIRETKVRLKRKGRLIGARPDSIRVKAHMSRPGDLHQKPSSVGHRRHGRKWKHNKDVWHHTHLNPNHAGRIAGRVANINSRYSKLKFGARVIGWGYVALAAASIMESVTTPGLSKSAEMNNAQTMGMAPPLDSSQAYTQRQRALMAIHDSQLGIRNVIGSEAGYLHR